MPAAALPGASGPAPSPEAVLLLLLAGLWTGLDATAFLQILVSQPLVAAWMGGMAVGDPATGLAVGMVLQGVWSRSLPMGASPLPAVGPAAVAAGAVAAMADGPRYQLGPVLSVPGALPVALALGIGIAAASLGRPLQSEVSRRRDSLLGMASRAIEDADPAGVVRANLLGAIPSGALGMALVAAGVLAGALGLLAVGNAGGGDGRWVAIPVLGVGLGQTASLAGARRTWWWMAAAVIVGVAAAWWGNA